MIGEFAKRPASKHKSNLRPITGQASEESKKQSNECFEVAKKHMMKKQYDQALKHYTNATIHNPSNFKALCNMGTIYKESGKFSEARSCYHRALFANPFDPITLYNLANLQRILGDDELAIAIYTKVTNLKEGQNMDIGTLYYDAYINQGICYKNLQLYDEAIACNDKAIQISPNDQPAYFNKSMCLLKKIYSLARTNFVSVKNRLCQEAELIFKKVLTINPNNFNVKMGLVQLKYLQEPSEKNFAEAVSQFQILQKTAPQSEKFQLSLKIKYCKNELKKIDQNKIILPPKQDIIEVRNEVNKYDSQSKPEENKNNKPAQLKRPESKKQSSAQNKRERKQPQEMPSDLKKQLQQGKSLRSLIDDLIEEKRFEEAFDLSQQMPDGMEKYETEVIINYSQCVEEQNETYLESAISIYNDFIIKNNENTPITKDLCSQKGHEVMATMLTVYGIFEQASKHYEVLLQTIQDQKFNKTKQDVNKEKLREIHAELGICYAERGLLQQAISQYRKSFEMQPDNYFLMTNLCGLLIQDGKNAEARKYYESYLTKNGGEKMEDKVAYIDSLLNLSICVRDTEEEEKAIIKAVEAIEKHFPTIEDIKENLHHEAILGLYLRQVDILQQKAETLKPTSPEKREIYEKMLDVYLTCLQFESCPDREAICINSGILFYLNGCYANALSFYKSVTVNKKVIANNLALTLLHMHEYERGANWLQIAIEQNPENVVFATNFEIVKWMCGMGANIIQRYNCQCESMYETRVSLGLWLIDQLTLMIDQNEMNVDFKKGSSLSVSDQVHKLVEILLGKAENSQKIQGRTQTWKSKSVVISRRLKIHMKECHSKGKQEKSNQLIPNDVLDLSLKVCKDSKQFSENFNKIMDYMSKLNDSSFQFSIIQTLISLSIQASSHLPDITQLVKSVIVKRQVHNTTTVVQSLESTEFKQAKIGYIEKKQQIDSPETQLKFKVLQGTMQGAECLLENAIQYFLQRIETVYYSNPDSVICPLNKEYTHPHCDHNLMCIRCVIGSSHLYSSIFGKKMRETARLSKNLTAKQEIESFTSNLQKFSQQNLQKEANHVYSRANNELTVKLQEKEFPILLKSHHKNFQSVVEFLKGIDKTFSISDEKSQKGVRVVQINKGLLLQMYWGENITGLDRFCHWLSRRSTNYIHDSVLFLGDELKELEELFQDGPKAVQKISASLYSRP